MLRVEGADKTAGIFTTAQAVPPTAITPARRPTCSQQRGARSPGQHTSSASRPSASPHPMAAPVPIRASEMIAPSIWDLADVGGGGSGNRNGNGRGGGGPAAAATGASSGVQASGVATQGMGGAPSHAGGGLGYSGTTTTLADPLAGGSVDGIGGTGAMIVSEGSTLFSTWGADQQPPPGWGSEATAAAAAPAASATAASRWRDTSSGTGDGAVGDAGGDGGFGGTSIDSAGRSFLHGSDTDADIYCRQGQQPQASAPSVVSSHNSQSSRSSSDSAYDFQHAEAAASKRHKTGTSESVTVAGATRPTDQHLQGYSYASLFSGDSNFGAPSGNTSTFGGALAYSAPGKLGEAAFGGVGLGDLAGDGFGTSGVDVGSAWVDAVFDSESASSSSPFLLNDK